jgi:hypothetical protein
MAYRQWRINLGEMKRGISWRRIAKSGWQRSSNRRRIENESCASAASAETGISVSGSRGGESGAHNRVSLSSAAKSAKLAYHQSISGGSS